LLQRLILPLQLLNSLIAAVPALQLLHFLLQPLNVLLRPGPDGTLGLAIIGTLPGKL
jgi:hypothetical protein